MEIGSEFWKEDKKYIQDNEELFLVGRTALDAIIKDMLAARSVTSALLPSYCCHTMIKPFTDNSIPIRFYDVSYEINQLCAHLPDPEENEIFYFMTYFGSGSLRYFDSHGGELSPENINQMWENTIDDRTHSYFHESYRCVADYSYVSLRKWMAVDGLAIAVKKAGCFSGDVLPKGWVVNKKYCNLRNDAFAMKQAYMSGAAEKAEFLEVFSEAEKLLKNDATGYRPSLNTVIEFYKDMEISRVEQIRNIRRRNACALYEGIKDISEIQFLIDVEEDGVCPLFVPILVPEIIRNPLRQYLINREIYCPVHWPLSEFHKSISDEAKKIYNQELSLICDQRYGLRDMEREVDEIRKFFR